MIKGKYKQFTDVRSPSYDESGGVTCWIEADKYLLRTYSTTGAKMDAIITLRDTHQKDEDNVRYYTARLSTEAARSGNVQSPDENITMYVDGPKE